MQHYSAKLPTHVNLFAINSSEFSTFSALNDRQMWLGLSKQQCQQKLTRHNLHSIAFAHWLNIPKLGLILTFKHQCCVEASYL